MHHSFLDRFVELCLQLAQKRSFDPLIERAMDLALEFMGAEFGFLVLLDDDGSFNVRVGRDKYGNVLERPIEQMSTSILHDAITLRKPLLIDDALSNIQSDSVQLLQLSSVMCAPLIVRDKVLGAIYVENRSTVALFEDDDLRLLTYFAALTAVAIENARLNDTLEQRVAVRTAELARMNDLLRQEITERRQIERRLHTLATSDSLTGLLNRRHFFTLAEQEMTRAKRYHLTFSLMLIDLDHFKGINDQFGHQKGDQALRLAATILQDHVRDVDIVARYGGDEFILLLPETPLPLAYKLAERLNQHVQAASSPAVGFPSPLTFSIGITAFTGMMSATIDTLLEQADQALYDSKRNGRNRVSLWHNAGSS